jgi:hypothetical protein
VLTILHPIARLAREGRPVPGQRLLVEARDGKRTVEVATVAADEVPAAAFATYY